MKIRNIFYLVFLTYALASCSNDPEFETAYLNGTITVADSVDDSKDYSGIQLIITYQESATSKVDTIFDKATNANGIVKEKWNFLKRNLSGFH